MATANWVGGMVGRSPQLRQVVEAIQKVAKTPSAVLITGESGTGKELVARALHANSPRASGPFVKVNCAAIPITLIESEMFGHERGAFTGAAEAKPGRFQLADGGSLFLDEIAEISPDVQVKLLRALQESEFERVGGTKTIKVDVRMVTATNRDLAAAIEAGDFRRDLYYRINVVRIHLPPLRDRAEDIPLLVQHFVELFGNRLQKQVTGIAPAALDCLMSYPWPGNIRELENVVERSMIFCEGQMIGVDDLPTETRKNRVLVSIPPPAPILKEREIVDLAEEFKDFRQLQKEGESTAVLGLATALIEDHIQDSTARAPCFDLIAKLSLPTTWAGERLVTLACAVAVRWCLVNHHDWSTESATLRETWVRAFGKGATGSLNVSGDQPVQVRVSKLVQRSITQ